MCSKESLLSLWSDRKGLENEICEDLNACGQLAVCKYRQAQSWELGPCGGVWLEHPVGRREYPCCTPHRSAESNYLCWYFLHGKDNWGLTSCRLSSWAMLNICYHDGKQTSLQGFKGQMTECIWKGFECKLPPRCKGDIKFDCFLVAVTCSSGFFVSHFCLLLRVFPKF